MSKKSLIFLMLALAAAGAAGLVPGKSGNAVAPGMRIAVPDDSGGLVVHYILKEKKLGTLEKLSSIESFPVRDC